MNNSLNNAMEDPLNKALKAVLNSAIKDALKKAMKSALNNAMKDAMDNTIAKALNNALKDVVCPSDNLLCHGVLRKIIKVTFISVRNIIKLSIIPLTIYLIME